MNTQFDEDIRDIRKSRDRACWELQEAVTVIGDEIARTTNTGPYLDLLIKYYQSLINEINAIMKYATDEVLRLPSVILAAQQLFDISKKMEKEAQKLPKATDKLNYISSILSLGNKFINLTVNAQK